MIRNPLYEDKQKKSRPVWKSNPSGQLSTVDYKEDGSIWVYYYDQKIDITDQFKDGVCYVQVSNGEKTLYMTILYEGGWCTSPHKYESPDSFS